MRRLPHQVISLIHYVELSDAGWWETTVDRCVLATLWLLRGPAPVSQIRKEIAKELDLDLKAGEISQSLARLENSEEVIRLNDGRFKLSLAAEQQFNNRVEESHSLEERVRRKFEQVINAYCSELDPVKLWAVFTDKLLIPLITDAGARIYEFFVMKKKKEEWESYTDRFLEEIPPTWREQVSEAIFGFLDPDDPDITRLILSYLDAYFVVTASGLSPKIARKLSELRKKPVDFVVFVDTNFVYSILGLHSNPCNETASDLMELVKSVSEELNVKFVISPVY